MKKILIFSGTTEGRQLSLLLSHTEILADVCVATEYGSIVMPKLKGITIHQGRMNEEEMVSFMKEGEYLAVVDATHPFATVVSENIKESAKESRLPYLRLQRKTDQAENEICFENSEECIKELKKTSGNILLTTGSKELSLYCKEDDLRKRIYARVLPSQESISLCNQAGLKGKQIIAIQGPFLEELNIALMNQYEIRYMVTKESGRTGGFFEKISAAKKAGVNVFVIGNPEKEEGLSFHEVVSKLEEMTKKRIHAEGKMTVSLVGTGMGDEGSCTVDGLKKIKQADYLFGAKRLLDSTGCWESIKSSKEQFPYYLAKDIIPVLDEILKEQSGENKNVAVLFSGDSGFYSGASKLYKELKEHFYGEKIKIEICPGISSISYFASKCKMNWNDAKIMSIHGKGEKENWIGEVSEAVRYNEKVIMIVSGAKNIREIGTLLETSGLTECQVYIGYQLSYEEEEIKKCSVKECQKIEKEGLYTIAVLNQKAQVKYLASKYKDGEFLRGNIPMSKEEIRSVIISRLQLTEHAVVYDVGSGTGSVAVEIAQRSGTIKVFAIERKEEGAELIRANKKKFQLPNIEVIEGKAPECFEQLPVPTHAFIGGSGGRLKEILKLLYLKNKKMRIVVTAVSMETVSELTEILKSGWIIEEDVIQMQVSRSQKAGSYHLMRAENPVYICSFGFVQKEKE